MKTPRIFEKLQLFAGILAVISVVQICSLVYLGITDLPHGMSLSMVLFRHSNAYPLMLLAAAVLLFQRNGLSFVCLLASLFLGFCDGYFAQRYGSPRINEYLVFDAVIRSIFVWYCAKLISKNVISNPFSVGMHRQSISLLFSASLLQASYIASYLFWFGQDGRNFITMSNAAPIFLRHIVFIITATVLLVAGALLLKIAKRSARPVLALASLFAFFAEISFYTFPALVTLFIAIISFWFSLAYFRKAPSQESLLTDRSDREPNKATAVEGEPAWSQYAMAGESTFLRLITVAARIGNGLVIIAIICFGIILLIARPGNANTPIVGLIIMFILFILITGAPHACTLFGLARTRTIRAVEWAMVSNTAYLLMIVSYFKGFSLPYLEYATPLLILYILNAMLLLKWHITISRNQTSAVPIRITGAN